MYPPDETHTVALDEGYFPETLGTSTPLDPAQLVVGVPLYLGIKVEQGPEMTPREEIVSVPYAFQAEQAEVAFSVVGDINPNSVSVNGTQAQMGICYQPNAGGTITNFVGGSYSIVQVTTNRELHAGSASVVPGAGTWRVGFCVSNFGGAIAITNNDFVNGWVIVTN